MQQSRIATHFNTDPADNKRFDWEAWLAGVPNSPHGYGENEEAAKADLRSRMRAASLDPVHAQG